MVILYLSLALLIITSLSKLKCDNNIHIDYLDKDNILNIKGIFVLMVLFSHFSDYIVYDGILDELYEFIILLFGQFIVTLFFFYSGYGIYESVKRKGKQYIQTFLKKRLLFVWLSFAVCVTFFLIGGRVLGNSFSSRQIVLSYLAWDNLGNSHWFMFVTFAAYILFYISFVNYKESKPINNLITFTVLVFVLMIFLYLTKTNCWWDTIICFPLGMWFSNYKNTIDRYMIYIKNWILSMILLIIMFAITSYLGVFVYHPIYVIASICFSLIVILLTMRIKIDNSMLKFLGNHVFSIYMLQRLVLMFTSLLLSNKYILFIVSLIIIIFIAYIFDAIMNKFKNYCLK